MNELVISSSSLNLFGQCRKAYQFGYVYNLDPIGTEKEVVENGTSIHKYLERAALGDMEWEIEAQFDQNAQVAMRYLEEYPLPSNILMVEDKTFFVELVPDVWVRCTFDLVYEDGGTIVLRDYKTFDKKPNFDLDLDFQGRFYIAAAKRHFKRPVVMEYVHIRQTPPNVPKDKAGNSWRPDECYFIYPLDIPDREAEDQWEEAQNRADDLVDALDGPMHGRFYRQNNKSWAGCSSCFYRKLCVAENQMGQLDAETLAQLARPRTPLTLPEGYKHG